MTLLSRKIEELIEESGETVASLAEMGKINRTTLQRVKSGERLPSKKFFANMCSALRLSLTEEEELETLLEMTQVGERVYHNRQKIIELIETIAELTEYKIPFSKELNLNIVNQKDGWDPTSNPEKIQIVTGAGAVLKMIESCIDKELFGSEQPHLRMAIPGTCDPIYQYIFAQMLGNKKQLSLQDVLNIPDECDESIADQGLGVLKYLVSLSLLDNVNYQSNFYYQSIGENREINVLFPYFILTSEQVITLSRDFSKAILYQDAELYHLYQMGFVKLCHQTEPFIEESSDLLTIYSLEKTYRIRQVVEPLPCFAYYATPEMVGDKIRTDFPHYETLRDVTIRFYDFFKKENRTMINVFSLLSLKQFMADGNMYFPAEVCDPFTPAERLMLVKQVRKDIFNDVRKTYALNDQKIFFNSAVEFINEATLIHLILHYQKGDKKVFKTIILKEKNIVNAFDDFFRSLPGSPYVLPKDETIAEMDKLITEYELQITGLIS